MRSWPACVRPSMLAKGFAARSVLLGGSTALAQLLMLAVTLLAVKWLSLEAFGQVSFFLAIALALGQFGALRLETAVLNESASERALASLCTAIFCSVGLVVAVLLLLFGDYLPVPMGDPEVIAMVLLVGAAVLANQFLVLHQGKVGAVRRVAIARVIQPLLSLLLLVMFREQLEVRGLLLVYLLGAVAALLPFAGIALSGAAVPYRDLLRRHRRILVYGTPQSLIDSVEQLLLPMLVAALTSARDLGSFRVAYTLVRAPVGLLGAAVSTPYVWVMRQRHAHRMTAFYAVAALAVLAAVVTVAGATLLQDMSWLRPYREQLALLVRMTPWMLGLMLVSPFSLVPVALGHQRRMMVWSLGYALLLFGSFVVALARGDLSLILVPSLLLFVYLAFVWNWYRKLAIGYESNESQ